MMLETPKEHLPPNYPQLNPVGYQHTWNVAFAIHKMHCNNPTSHRGIINPVDTNDGSYCDCYEHAYQQVRPDRQVFTPTGRAFRTIVIVEK